MTDSDWIYYAAFIHIEHYDILIHVFDIFLVLFYFTEMNIENPSFSGNSYIQYPPLEGVSRSTMLQVVFRPNTLDDGVIMYAGENQFGSGDYIAILLKKG